MEMSIKSRSTRASESLIAVSGVDLHKANIVEFYDPNLNLWSELVTLSKYRHRCCSIVFEGKLLLIGGEVGGIYQTDVDTYDFQSGQFGSLTPMNYNVYDCAVAILDDYLYLVGGDVIFTGAVPHLQRYSSNTRSWEAMPDLPSARRRCQAVGLNSELFVIGGMLEGHPLSDVVAFNPNSRAYRTCASTNEKREGVSAAALNGFIYVVGGHDGTNYIKTAEKYDPVSNSWTYIVDSNWIRGFAEAVDFNNAIVVAGGIDGDKKYTAVVESYDPDQNRFNVLAPMTQPRIYFNLINVPWELVKKSIALKNKRKNENNKNPQTTTK